MIVKNESKLLAGCLESIVSISDEIIIVDTGSTDSTVDVAKKFTPNIYFYPWKDDFSAARNYSLSHATGEWVLVIDADERLVKSSVASLLELVRTVPHDIPQVFNFLAVARGRQPLFTRALFPNLSGMSFKGAIHESLRYDGHIPKQWHCSNICYEHIVSDSVSPKKAEYYLSLIVKELQLKLSVDERVVLQKHLCNAYLDLNQEHQALVELEKCLSLFKRSSYDTNDIFYLNLMKDLVTTGLKIGNDNRRYLKYATKLVKEASESTEKWLLFCYALFCNAKFRACLSTIEDILQSERVLKPEVHISLLIMRARCFFALSEIDMAIYAFHEIYVKNPLEQISSYLCLLFLVKDEKKKAYAFLPPDYSHSLFSCKKWLKTFTHWNQKEILLVDELYNFKI